jgi:hypothetical protein
MQQRVPVGISMPRKFIIWIDSERGDVPRSRYIQKLIETGIVGRQKEKEKLKVSATSQDDPSTTAATQQEATT